MPKTCEDSSFTTVTVHRWQQLLKTPSGATLLWTPSKEYRNQTRNVRDVDWPCKVILV